MTAVLIFIAVVIGLNCIPLLTKMNSPKMEKAITQILIYTSLVFVIFTLLLFNDYRLKGIYTNWIIGLAFIISNLLFFVLVKNRRKKFIIVLLMTPLTLLSLITLIFGQVIAEYRINDFYKIEVSNGGFLSCGEIIKITKSEFVFFNKEVYYESGLCLRGIDKIETLEFNKNHANFLIYHNGEMDSENPYSYEIKNKNVW